MQSTMQSTMQSDMPEVLTRDEAKPEERERVEAALAVASAERTPRQERIIAHSLHGHAAGCRCGG